MSEKDEMLTNGEMTEETTEEVVKSSEKDNQKRWYIVHTYSGYENKVKSNLEKRIEYMNMGDKIFRVEVPQKTVTQIKWRNSISPGFLLMPSSLPGISMSTPWSPCRSIAEILKKNGFFCPPDLISCNLVL